MKAWNNDIPVPLSDNEVTWIAATPCCPNDYLTELMEEMFPRRSLEEMAARDPLTLGRMIASAAHGINCADYDLSAARNYLQCVARVEKGDSLQERYAMEGFAFDGEWVELPHKISVFYHPESDRFWLSLGSVDIFIRETGDGPPEVSWEER